MHIGERPELQREVQRLLGRCLLRLQQYEYLLKRLLAHAELAGPLHELEARRAARIEQFDVWSVEGCEAATKHLVDSYARIDGSCRELHLWATSLDDALRSQAEFIKTDIFLDFIANGIAPDGTVDWPSAGIVRVLRRAGQTLAVDGWTPLDQAVAWITERHPEQTPAKYNCRSWQQVLNESRVFLLEYRPDERGGRIGWYRDRDSGSRSD